jgi:hypothetical protein
MDAANGHVIYLQFLSCTILFKFATEMQGVKSFLLEGEFPGERLNSTDLHSLSCRSVE